jgi:ATP-binding cassette, subfamily B, bacterial
LSRSDPSADLDADMPRALPSLWRTFRLGYRAEPRLLALTLGLALLMMLPDALLAWWLKLLVDGLSADPVTRRTITAACIGIAISLVLTWYLRIVSSRVQRRFRDRIAIALESHVARLQASIPTIEHHERPELLDRLARLRDQVFALDHLFMSLFSTLGWLFRLLVVAVLLASVHPALVLLMLFALPAFVTSTWRPGVERRVEEAHQSRLRLGRHLFQLGTAAASAKELRVLGTADGIIERRAEVWEQWYRPVARVRTATAMWHAAVWLGFGVAYSVAIALAAGPLDQSPGEVTLVVFAGIRTAAYVGATAGELGFLRGIWLDASKRLTWLEDYAAAADPGTGAVPPAVLHHGITFDHVTFRYPGTDRNVLDDVSFTLPAGSVVAIVGENGAGKSTLVKLLARMYQPTSGTIHLDDVPLAQVSSVEWRDRLAGAFQDFYRFEFVAQHTVGTGDLPRLDDRSAAQTAVDRAGAADVVERLGTGLDRQLGPTWPDGADLSFGQWQKLALARGFMRDEPLLLMLDEPTAALDAETEHELFERFAAAARNGDGNGRITVLVSHRFSTVRMADLIVVLDGARLVEIGSHDDLVAYGGLYAELYGTQAAAYR